MLCRSEWTGTKRALKSYFKTHELKKPKPKQTIKNSSGKTACNIVDKMVDKMADGRQLGLVADHALQKAKIKKIKSVT